ncbi:MAG: hypothetical protein CM15mP59_4430 [Flavobacteriaceae bacterium]|nr:MAG: hypothetical protein CM15mP59_4430 [Flavobacteriaceae bacterium]
MSHYERMLIYLYQVTSTEVHFAESLETIGENLNEVNPDVMTAVPRFLGKNYMTKFMARDKPLLGSKRNYSIGLLILVLLMSLIKRMVLFTVSSYRLQER